MGAYVEIFGQSFTDDICVFDHSRKFFINPFRRFGRLVFAENLAKNLQHIAYILEHNDFLLLVLILRQILSHGKFLGKF
jgi:hypothetical protein